jgi:uncharacterized protein with PIN domain
VIIDTSALIAILRAEPDASEMAHANGTGSGHKAGLNFGDCFAYALAKTTGEALLFKGNDFGHTGITPALLPPLTPAHLTPTSRPSCCEPHAGGVRHYP